MNLRSSVVIAQLLDSEGFSDFVANQVERYWMRNICHPGRRRKYKRLDTEVSELCKKLTDAEKLILGKFIGLHKKMAFDTGLRIGLSAFAQKTDKEFPEFPVGAELTRAGTRSESSSGNKGSDPKEKGSE